MKNIRLLKMRWSGLYSFGPSEQTYEFKPGFHLIVGRNGSGKSSFMNVVSLCLFDKSPSLNKREALNDQYEQGSVVLSLTVDMIYYEVYYARSKSELQWVLARRAESGIMTKVVDGKDTGRYIEQLIGFDYNQFVNAFYLTQSGSTSMRLVFGAPAERLDILSRLFGLNKYEQASDLALAKASEYGKMEADVGVKIIGKESEIKGIGSVEEALEVLNSRLIKLREDQSKFSDLENQIFEMKQKRDKLHEEKQFLYDRDADRKDEINRLSIELVRAQDDVKKLKEIVDLFKLYQSEKDSDRADERKNQILKDSIAEAIKEKEVIGKQYAVLKSQVQDLEKRINSLMKGEGRCDKCGSTVTDEELKSFKEALEIELVEKGKSYNMYGGQLGSLTESLYVMEKEHVEVSERMRKFDRRFEKVREFDIDTEQRFNDEQKKCEAIINKISELNATLETTTERKKKIELDLSSVVEKIDSLQIDLTQLSKIKKEEEIVLKQVEEKVQDGERVKKIQEEIVLMNERRVDLISKIEGYKFWIKGFKDLEILTLCGLLNGINSKIDETLSRFGMSCWLDVLEEKKGSKTGLSLDDFKRKVNIFVKAEGKDHVPIEGYSGGEKQLIALGLILAMGSTVSDFNFLGLDEVFGSLDETNRGSVIQLLEEERERGLLEGKTVIVVSHDEDIKSGIDWDSITMMDKTEQGTEMKRLK